MFSQWLDILDCDEAHMTRKKRVENMSTVVRDNDTYRVNVAIPSLDWSDSLEW